RAVGPAAQLPVHGPHRPADPAPHHSAGLRPARRRVFGPVHHRRPLRGRRPLPDARGRLNPPPSGAPARYNRRSPPTRPDAPASPTPAPVVQRGARICFPDLALSANFPLNQVSPIAALLAFDTLAKEAPYRVMSPMGKRR